MSSNIPTSQSARIGFLLPTTCACLLALLGSGCAMDAFLSPTQVNALANPPANVVTRINGLQHGVATWYREAEQTGFARGRPLDSSEMQLAREVGVAEPERVRVVITDAFPVPSNPQTTARLNSAFGVGTDKAPDVGKTFGYAIFIRVSHANKRWLLAHELTHVAQFEKLGIDGFAHEYLLQLMLVGHSLAPLESAAINNQRLGK